MARVDEQTHLEFVPSTTVDFRRWVRNAAVTINGILNGQDARPRVWTDYLASLDSAKVEGANTPTWSVVQDGIYAYSFSATVLNEAWVQFHINHDVAITADAKIYPHIHWTANTANTGTCRWGFEYSYAKGHQQGASSVFPSSTTVYVEQAFSGTAFEHHIGEVADGDAISVADAGIEVDGVILMRVFRDGAHANDTLTSAAFGIFVNLHIQVERDGTVNKSPNFYGP